MLIDVHAHVYMDPRLKPRPHATPFMSAEQQIAVMDKLGVDMAVILPLNSAECPAEPQSIGEVLSICERYPGRFIPFCHIDPRLPRRPGAITVEHFDFILGQYHELGCKGIGELTTRIPWTHHSMLCMLEAAEKLEMAVTFHTITEDEDGYGIIDEVDLPGLETVLKRFPKLAFFGHSQGFWSEISGDVSLDTKNIYPKGAIAPGGTLIRLFRECPNLCGDISAGSGYNALTRDLEFGYQFMDEFQDRLLLGMDFCSVKNKHRHIWMLQSARDAGHISPEAYEKIAWRNANRILKLGLDAGSQ